MEALVYILILVMAVLGTPIFAVMSAIALFAFTMADIDTSAVPIEIYRIAAQPTLLTIPLFTFAGYLMAESGSPTRLLRLARAAFGWLPGGIAIVSLIICAFFTAFTGASGVTIIALGGLLYPILRQEGFSERFSLGLVTTSGSLGLLFPPSLPIILYGLVARVDIDKLFLAGIIPGILLIVILSGWAVAQGRDKPVTTPLQEQPKFSLQELWQAARGARYEIPLPILVLTGIYGGYTTASEASAFTAAWALLMGTVLYKDVHPIRDLPRIIRESMTLVGAILLILCCALGVTNYLVDEEIPMQILAFIKQHVDSKLVFLIYLNIFLLVVGSLMDIFSAIIIVVPLIVPIATSFGVHPVHLAVIFLTNLEIGYITPPVGLNLFISSFRFGKPVTTLYRASLPYLLLLIIALLIITYVPLLSLFLVE